MMETQIQTNTTESPELRRTHKKPKILLIDDEASFTDMLKINLELTADYSILVENDSREAIRTADRAQPDLILLDAIMPGLDGFEVLNRLEMDPLTRHIPVVFLTAISEQLSFSPSNFSEIVQRKTLAKPVRMKELISTIEETLKKDGLNS
ncbi:MAG: response regulator [Verrucomicrobiales bacterium]|nr:response regulator [Verrucomicrobiales bacterium]